MPGKVPDPIDQHVGSRIRMRRLMLDMSQTALGVTFQQVQKYEKGIGGLGASRLQKISEILQVPVAFLFEGVPAGAGESEPAPVGQEAGPPVDVTDDPMAPERLALLGAFMRVKDPKMRNNIIRLIEEIAPAAGAFGAPDDQGN
jgi:transcriptional regulator with XRE-family HTH domain